MDMDGEAGPAKRLKTSGSSKANTRKWSGAALYKTKFQQTWQKAWPFVTSVKDNPHAFYCSVCMKTASCGHQGERDIVRHADSAQHQKNVRAMKSTQPLGFVSVGATDPLKDKVHTHAWICLKLSSGDYRFSTRLLEPKLKLLIY